MLVATISAVIFFPFLGPLVAILNFVVGAALQAVGKSRSSWGIGLSLVLTVGSLHINSVKLSYHILIFNFVQNPKKKFTVGGGGPQ